MSPLRPTGGPRRARLSSLKLSSDSAAPAFDLEHDQLLDLLATGDIEIEGRVVGSSNATFLVTVTDPSDAAVTHRAIYKPGGGERPLWDFPPDLYKREVATFLVSRHLGWDVVPPTAIGTGPHGEGSVQAFVDADFSQHYFTLVEDKTDLVGLRRLCLLDLIINNTDRKSGHCLLGRDGRVYGIDHGLSFHTDFKLRTVIWDFVDDGISPTDLIDLRRFISDDIPVGLYALLSQAEVASTISRVEKLVTSGTFPVDDTGGHRYPWPLV